MELLLFPNPMAWYSSVYWWWNGVYLWHVSCTWVNFSMFENFKCLWSATIYIFQLFYYLDLLLFFKFGNILRVAYSQIVSCLWRDNSKMSLQAVAILMVHFPYIFYSFRQLTILYYVYTWWVMMCLSVYNYMVLQTINISLYE